MFIRETYRHKGKASSGFILLLTLVLMTTLSAIAGTLIVSLTTDFRNAYVQTNDAKAFWLAEAGIADAVKRFKNDEINLADAQTDNTTMQDVVLGDGTYSVVLSRSGNEVTITSTGTVSSQSRTVTVVVVITQGLPPAFNYAVFGNNSNNATLSIGDNNSATVTISGDLFYDPRPQTDRVVVRNNSKVINGLIYANVVTGGGTFTKATSPPNPVPTYPSFSTTTYDNLIATADSATRPNLTLSGTTNLNLSGGVVYYNDVIIQGSATVTGPGTIVARRDVTIQASASIGQGVNIVAKRNVLVRNLSAIQKDGLLYSRGSTTVRDSANVTSSLLAPQSSTLVRVWGNATVTGIIFADQINLINNAVVNGSAVSNRFTNNRISNNVKVNFDQSYLPDSLPPGFSSAESISQKANSWKEI